MSMTFFTVNYFEVGHDNELYCMDNIKVEVRDFDDCGADFVILSADMCGEEIPEVVMGIMEADEDFAKEVDELYLAEANSRSEADKYESSLLAKRMGELL